MTHNKAQVDRIRHAGRRGAKHDRTTIRRRPLVEILEGRMLLAVAFDPATATFTGDGTAHTLLLSESGGFLAYAVDPDTDPNAQLVPTATPITTLSPPTITVDLGNLGTAGNTLRLDSSWTFTDPVTFTGGAGGDNLDDETGTADTWTLSDANNGNINGKVTFSSVVTAIGSGGGTLTGADSDSTWDFAATQTYALVASPGAALTFTGFGTFQGGTAADSFDVTGDGVSNQVTANLNGGAGNDSFAFSNGTQLFGNIDGQTGTNTLDYGANPLGAAVGLTGTDANGYTGTEATSLIGTFQGISNLIGANSGGDQLTGLNLNSAWALGATRLYQASGHLSLGFSGFNDLEGGTGNDAFAVTAAQPGLTLVNGGAGSDSLDLSVYTVSETATLAGSSVTGFSGGTSSALGTADSPGGFDGMDLVIGRAGDTLTGEGVVSTWALDTIQTYDDGAFTLPFSGFGNLQGGAAADAFDVTSSTTANLAGGAGADAFVFDDGTTLTGTVNGQAGVDTLDLSADTSPVAAALTGSGATGFAGSDGVTSGFSGIDVLTAGTDAGNVLTGEDSASTWALGTSQTVTVGAAALTFSNFGALQGGTAADAFNITADTTADLAGGAGADAFVFGAGTALTGTVDGEAGNDTLNYSGLGFGTTVILTGEDANGYVGTEASTIFGTFNGIDNLVGAGSGDGLAGLSVVSTWSLGSTQTYQAVSDPTLTFSGFLGLQGGGAADTFNVNASTTADLAGGAGADAFVFGAGTALTGTVDGQGGVDTLNIAAYTTGEMVSLTGFDATVPSAGFSGGTSSATGGFAGIDSLVGRTGDTLAGDGNGSTWNLGTTPTYQETSSTDTVAFSGFDTLQGGAGVDRFNILATTSASLLGGDGNDSYVFSDGMGSNGTINGQGGSDTLNYSAYTTSVFVNVGARTATGTNVLLNIDSMTGSDTAPSTLLAANATNNWSITGADTGVIAGPIPFSFTNVGNLTGGILNDAFTFAAGAFESGIVSGGSGTNTLNMATNTTGVTVNITANNGGSATANGVTFSFSGVANLVGGSGANTFVFGSGRTISGTINGGSGGNNTLDYSAYTTGVRVNLLQMAAAGVNSGAVNGISNIQNVTGGAGDDILIGNAANNVLAGNGGNNVLTGGAGNDTLFGGTGRDILIAGSGSDTLHAGTGEDIVLADATTFDANITALTALMAEWGRTDLNYATRVGHLDGTIATGGRNGSYKLTSATVIADLAADIVTSGAGLDWYIAPSIDNAILPALRTIGGVTEKRTTL